MSQTVKPRTIKPRTVKRRLNAIGACAAMAASLLAVGSVAVSNAAAAGTWTPDSALPAVAATTGAQAVPDPLGGSVLFYVLNGVPTIAPVAASGTVGASAPVPAVAPLSPIGTPGQIAFLPSGAAIVTWTLTTYGVIYMAYRSPSGSWAAPVEAPSGFSNLAVRSGEVLTSESDSTGVSVESWTLSASGGLTLKSGPTHVYTGQPLFNQSWLALDSGGTAELVVFGSTDNGNTEAVGAVTRDTTGKWSAQTQLSPSGVSVSSAAFATAPGGRSIVTWVTGSTAIAANSYAAVRTAPTFGAAVATGSVSNSNGAYIIVRAAAGADGTLAVATTQRIYNAAGGHTDTVTVRLVSPTGKALGAGMADPEPVLPSSLGAGHGEALIGSVVATYGAGEAGYPSSYSADQQVIASIVAAGTSAVNHQLGASSGYYDGNGGDGCPCPQSPPVASITGVALEPAGGAVTVGQLSPGGVLESARYVVATVPTAPTNLKTGYGNGKVTLTWGAPASDGGSVITGYNVYEGTSAGGESTKPVNSSPLAATARGYTVSGLKNGTRYYFKARALNTLGTSPPSNEASAVPRTEPGAPGSLKAVAGNAKVTLSWTPPASDGGSPVTGYDVYEGTKPGGESTKPVNSSPISSSAKSYGVSSLKNHTKYYFKVKAINSVGIGASSNEASATPV